MLFAHQRDLSLALARRFNSCKIITADDKRLPEVSGITIISSQCQSKSRLLNALNFYRLTIPFLIKKRKSTVVFSYMTEVQSMLIAPLTKLLGIRHFLWYAHAHKSIYLTLVWKFISGVLTSSSGSCPLSGPRVFYIGQAVNDKIFFGGCFKASNPPLKWYTVGRVDPSKRIEVILESFLKLRLMGWPLELEIFGEPSSKSNEEYFNKVKEMCLSPQYSSWAKLNAPVKNSLIAKRVVGFDGFVHAFNGSLDKTLIEAMMLRKVVVSTNLEFQRLFKTHSSDNVIGSSLLNLTLDALNSSPQSQIVAIEENYINVVKNHSAESWLDKVEKILKS